MWLESGTFPVIHNPAVCRNQWLGITI